MLLRVALILVQAVLQLQSECVIVGSHDLQHLGEVKGQQGSVRTNSRSLAPCMPLLLPYHTEFSLGQYPQETLLTTYHPFPPPEKLWPQGAVPQGSGTTF